MATETPVTAAAKPHEPSFADTHWGRGGRYVTFNGKRVPAEPAFSGSLKSSPGTGEEMTPVAGDTLTAQGTDKPIKGGK